MCHFVGMVFDLAVLTGRGIMISQSSLAGEFEHSGVHHYKNETLVQVTECSMVMYKAIG